MKRSCNCCKGKGYLCGSHFGVERVQCNCCGGTGTVGSIDEPVEHEHFVIGTKQ